MSTHQNIESLDSRRRFVEQTLVKNSSKSLESAQEYLQVSEEADNVEHIAYANRFIGYSYRNLGELDAALRFYFRALRFARRAQITSITQHLLNDIGVVYRSKGQYYKALEFYFQALEGGSIHTIASTYNNIAVIYYKQRHYEKSLAFFKKALEILTQIGNESAIGIYITKANIGDIYFKLGELDSAEMYYQAALEGAENNGIAQASFLSNLGLGRIYIKQGLVDQGFSHFEEALNLCNKASLSGKRHAILMELAESYNKVDDFESAERYFLEALTCAQTEGSDRKLHTLQKIHRFYGQYGEYQKAYEFIIKWEQLKQKVFSETKEREITRLQINLETKEKEKEIELLKKENELKNLLIEKGEEIKRKNKELQEFSYAISHDLKEPVRMMKSFTQLLEKKPGSSLTEEEQSLLRFVSDGASRLAEMIDDLYRYATLGSTPEDITDEDLNKIVEIAISNIQLQISESNAKIEIHELPTIKGIKSHLIQLFQNLISNAIKFKKDDIDPAIEVFCSKNDQSELEITVKDNGVGIEERHLQNIFKIFRRVGSTEKVEGSGIGLSLCNKIVMNMGGELKVSSEPGVGSMFIIQIKKAGYKSLPISS